MGGSAQRWWQNDPTVDRRISGVFEGGGAKGVLYASALQGVLDERCWFDAVAGSSAGAITAMLVAAGMKPCQIKQRTKEALDLLHPPAALNGVRRMRSGASWLDQESLVTWLRCQIEATFCVLNGQPDMGTATFADLHRLTDIELNVVAVDVQRSQVIVFNHHLTPSCQVADAVVASAAIPFAFEWKRLNVPNSENGMIVDGGVAANFPGFVFNDRSFRRWANMPDRTAFAPPVVGFLLDEGGGEDRDASLYQQSTFADDNVDGSRPKFRPAMPPRRRGRRGRFLASIGSAVAGAVEVVATIAKVVLWLPAQLVFNWLPRAFGWNGRNGRELALGPRPHRRAEAVRPTTNGEPDREHRGDALERASSASRYGRIALDATDRMLMATRPFAFFVVALASITASLAVGVYTFGWLPLVNATANGIHGETSIFATVWEVVFFVFVMLANIYAWLVIVPTLTSAALAHATVRNIGYGLARTFLQGPGAPPWTGSHPDDHVIRIPVPSGLKTLKSSVEPAQLEAAFATAKDLTRVGVRGLWLDGSNS